MNGKQKKKKNSCKGISDALSNTTSIFADPAQDMDEKSTTLGR